MIEINTKMKDLSVIDKKLKTFYKKKDKLKESYKLKIEKIEKELDLKLEILNKEFENIKEEKSVILNGISMEIKSEIKKIK